MLRADQAAPRDAPYAPDIRAKGWRFELDHERIEQSDTWALAPLDMRPWLLMLWMTAWRQAPCGSLPADDGLIAARIGMSPKVFERNREVLRRGWWLASDGRLYHDVIVGMVETMVTIKNKERTRKADWRVRKEAERSFSSRGTDGGQTRDRHGTDTSATSDGRVSDDTGTGTGTGTSNAEITHHPRSTRAGGGESAKPTKAGEICRAIRAKGVADASPSHPVLLEYIAKGVTVEVFEAAAETCAKARPPKGMAYLLGIVKRQLGEAAAIASGVGMQERPWDESRSTIEAKGIALGLGMWDANDLSVGRETFAAYTERVRRAMECTGAAA